MKSEFALSSMETAIVMAKGMLEIEGVSDYDQFIWQLAKFSVGKMQGLLLQSVKVFEVEVIDGHAEIPAGSRVLGIRYCQDTGQASKSLFADFAWTERCNIDFGKNVAKYPSDIMITNDAVIFQWPALAPKTLRIAVLCKEFDGEGFPMVPEHYLDAIMSYICYNFARRHPKKYTSKQHDDWYNDWVAQRNYAVGYDAKVNWQRNQKQALRLTRSTFIRL